MNGRCRLPGAACEDLCALTIRLSSCRSFLLRLTGMAVVRIADFAAAMKLNIAHAPWPSDNASHGDQQGGDGND